jgi:hypothetical protein
MHSDSIGTIVPRFFTIFGLMWMMGVIGVLRLYAVVNAIDYIVLCCLASCGGVMLFLTVHFAGNVPMEGRILIRELKFSYEAVMARNQRKYLRKSARSLQLFGLKSGPIRLLKHNAIYLYFGGLINFIVTFLVAHPDLAKT